MTNEISDVHITRHEIIFESLRIQDELMSGMQVDTGKFIREKMIESMEQAIYDDLFDTFSVSADVDTEFTIDKFMDSVHTMKKHMKDHRNNKLYLPMGMYDELMLEADKTYGYMSCSTQQPISFMGMMVEPKASLPEFVTEQSRFPRSKRKRVQKKWAKNVKNYKKVRKVYMVDTNKEWRL